MHRAERLRGSEGRQAIYSDRIFNFRGTEIERMFFDNPDTLVASGAQHLTPETMNSPVPEEILDVMSPMRNRLADVATDDGATRGLASQRGECFAEGVFSDYSVLAFVEEHRDYTRPQLDLHPRSSRPQRDAAPEYGHVIGLRHNFTGTVDAPNFHPEYHEIIRDYPLPTCSEGNLSEGNCVGPDPRSMNNEEEYRACVEKPDTTECRDTAMNYDMDSNGVLNRDEMRFLTRAQANVRRWRELAGMESTGRRLSWTTRHPGTTAGRTRPIRCRGDSLQLRSARRSLRQHRQSAPRPSLAQFRRRCSRALALLQRR